MEKQTKFNRRGFLKSSAIGAAGIIAGKSAMGRSSLTNFSGEEKSGKKVYRTLGRTGIKLPIVSMGVMRSDNPNLVRAALDKGVEHLDTAHGYQEGRNEKMLGEILKDYPRRSYTIATKIHQPGMDRKTGKYSEEATEKSFMDMFEVSMERLGLDYVDILYHHAVGSREGTLHKPTLNAMQKIKESGRARSLGISTHSREPEVIRAAIESGVYDVVLVAYNFKQDHVDEVKAAIDEAAKAGLGIVAMKTMAGGFYDKERQKPVNTKAALKWALQSKNVHTAIPGFTSFDHLEESYGIMENPELTKEEKEELKKGESIASLYCNGCRDCVDQCSKSLPVSDIMRAYMYTYGYRQTEKAHTLLSSLNVSNDPCTSCNFCTVNCTSGFNVAEKIKDVSRLVNVPKDFVT